MEKMTKDDLRKRLEIELDDGQAITEELLEEFSDGKGDDEDE